MKFFGINQIGLEGYKFETGFGFSKHITLTLNKKKYFPLLAPHINNWGVENVWKIEPTKIKCKIVEKQNFLYFSAFTSNVCCPSKICGCCVIKLGESPWGPYSNFLLGRVKRWKRISINVKWTFGARGIGDLMFDVWLTKRKRGIPRERDIELMVWLDSENLKPFGERKSDFENFEVFYSPVEKTREFIPHQPCGTISYFLKQEYRKEQRFYFDLTKLILNLNKYFRVKNIENYWIRV